MSRSRSYFSAEWGFPRIKAYLLWPILKLLICQFLVFLDRLSVAWCHHLKNLYGSDVELLVKCVRNRFNIWSDEGYPALGESINSVMLRVASGGFMDSVLGQRFY